MEKIPHFLSHVESRPKAIFTYISAKDMEVEEGTMVGEKGHKAGGRTREGNEGKNTKYRAFSLIHAIQI